ESRQLPYDFVVVDEAQDVSVAQLRFLSALGADRPGSLFFAGDLGQRIFQTPFSWRSLGVDVRGRSTILRVNYRTSHQIRTQADCLLAKELADVDGNKEKRSDTVSVFNGPRPFVATAADEDAEATAVARWLAERAREGVAVDAMAVLVRSTGQYSRARAAIETAGLGHIELGASGRVESGRVAIGTMHQSKGLEFRTVVVMACDDDVLPLQERIESAVDDSDLKDVYDTERHLLYVACTRARDHLMVSGVEPASEFLNDLRG
ncbi:MAG TPA: 3'-5' exonuclease, partial [Gemmatimonadaceae bacterium]|nr:3'-5' exonuclease [Gemmatimonadaceae bacterium]